MKRLALILFALCMAPHPWCAANPVDDLFRQAQASENDKKYDDAVATCEHILIEHPEAGPDAWFNAQRSIAENLARKGDLAGAAQAVHLCLDGAPNPDAFNQAVAFAAEILSAQDGKVDRANQFLAYAQAGSGPANPMDAVGYPSLPAREKAFETMREQAGDTPAASRLRAYTFLFTGKPKEALAQFADGFRRSSTIQDLQQASADLAIVGLRAVRGHGAGLDKALQFVIDGPNGPDGKPNTTDDLADPFAQWLPAPPPPGQGGLAGLSPDDLAALRKVHDACQLYAGDPWVDGNLRIHSFLALARVNTALDNWGAPGQKDWYLDCALGLNNVYDILSSLMAAARDRALNFAGTSALLDEIDAKIAAGGVKPTNGLDKGRAQFQEVTSYLKRIHFPTQPIAPLKNPARF